jgi:choice-of-anchor A domain-containing protein
MIQVLGMRLSIARMLSAAAMLLATESAQLVCAQEVDLGTAAQYAGFFFGNASNLSDVVGRLAVGGNLSIGGTSVGEGVAKSSTQPSLVVGGDITAFTSGSMGSSSTNNYGDYVGKKGSAVPSYLLLHQVAYSPVDFAAESIYLKVLSQQLSARKATGQVSQQWNTVTLTGSNSDIEVFNLSAAQVQSTLTMALVNVKSSATLIFNVASNSQRLVQFGITTTVLQNRQGKVLYNMPDADLLNFTGVWVWGSVLAPVACVNNSNGHIEGTIVAASWNSNMEIGNSPFLGSN